MCLDVLKGRNEMNNWISCSDAYCTPQQWCRVLWTSGVWSVGEWAVPGILKDCCALTTLTTTQSPTKYHFPEDLNL